MKAVTRKLVATITTVIFSLGAQTPANSSSTEWTAYQRTLATYSGSTTSLSELHKSQIRATLDSAPKSEKFICTGIRYYDQPMNVNIMVRKRAKEACEYAKQLKPSLSTWFQNKPTKARSYAGKVLLTVKTPIERKIPEIAPPEKLPSQANEQLPTLLPPDRGSISPAKKAAYRQRISQYEARISAIQQLIDELTEIREQESKKLEIASSYGDELREGIQEDAISEIDNRISSYRSNQAFYRSLIRTYESRIEASNTIIDNAPVVPSGPSQRQIDSWNRLIAIYESSIARAESQIDRISQELRKLVYWRSVAERYGDTARVEELNDEISQANRSIDEYRSSIQSDQAEIAVLREKIRG